MLCCTASLASSASLRGIPPTIFPTHSYLTSSPSFTSAIERCRWSPPASAPAGLVRWVVLVADWKGLLLPAVEDAWAPARSKEQTSGTPFKHRRASGMLIVRARSCESVCVYAHVHHTGLKEAAAKPCCSPSSAALGHPPRSSMLSRPRRFSSSLNMDSRLLSAVAAGANRCQLLCAGASWSAAMTGAGALGASSRGKHTALV